MRRQREQAWPKALYLGLDFAQFGVIIGNRQFPLAQSSVNSGALPAQIGGRTTGFDTRRGMTFASRKQAMIL